MGISIFFVLVLLFVSPAIAQSRAASALREVDIEATPGGWDLDLHFEFPVRYLRHSPQSPGRSLRIGIDPLGLGFEEALLRGLRQSLPIPRERPNPVLEIIYDSSLPGEPFVEVEFDESFRFEVEQVDGLRNLRIRARAPSRASTVGTDSTRADQLFSRARDAIRDGELDLAIALLNRVLEEPEGEVSLQTRMDARELVGLTHERRGQRAHALAEYEAYLEDYPDGPAAPRVRQRLDALLTASSAPRESLRRSSRSAATKADGDPIRTEYFGSIGARYFRAESVEDDAGGNFLASNLLADFDLAGELETESWAVRGDFTGTYDFDLSGEGRSDDSRISRMSVRVEDRLHGLEAVVGRQRRNDNGIIGRFDGIRLAADLGSHVTVSALAGLPVERTYDSTPNTDTVLGGGAIEVEDFWIDGLAAKFFVVGQNSSSLTGRVALGGEVRYAGPNSYSFVYLDYDANFESLNTFLASSSYRVTNDTDLRALVERRNSPILTLRSALQGQPVDNLDDLQEIFSESEILDLARDRTSVSWSGSVGASHRPTDRLQLSADLLVTYFGSTETSGGVPGTDAFGPDFGGSAQIIVNDWLVRDDVGSLSVRYFEGENVRSFAAAGYSRFRFFDDLRIIPRLLWEWRDSEIQGSQSRLRPSLEMDWGYSDFYFNAEAGIEWLEPLSGGEAFGETLYFLELGIRWDF